MKDEESHQSYTSMSGICWHSCVTHPLPSPPTLASFSFLFLLSFIVCQFASLQGSACVAPLIIWQRFCPHLEKPVLPYFKYIKVGSRNNRCCLIAQEQGSKIHRGWAHSSGEHKSPCVQYVLCTVCALYNVFRLLRNGCRCIHRSDASVNVQL